MAKEELMDAVIKAYQDKLRQNPNSLVFVQLADAYRKKGSFEEALQVIDEGLQKNANLMSAQLMAGRLHAAMKRHDKAVEMLKKVVQREPSNLSAHALLSQSYIELGRLQEAIGEFQRILALNPEDQSAQQSLRSALDKMRKEGPAAKQASAAARPASPVTAPLAPPADAGASVTAPLAPPADAADTPVAPSAASAVSAEVPAFAAADELAMRGMYDEAVEAYQRILDVDPDNYMARSKLREVYRMRNAIEAPSAPEKAPVASAAQPAPVQPKETQADKISDDEILYLLGLMEATADTGATGGGGGGASRAGAVGPAPVLDEPLLGDLEKLAPAPRVEFRAAAPSAEPPQPPPAAEERVSEVAGVVEAPSIPAAPKAAAPKAAAAKAPAAKAPAAKAPAAKAPASAVPPLAAAGPAIDEGKIREVLNRLAGTEGMRQAFLVSGEILIATGEALGAEQAERAIMLVRMISDITRRAAESMKQGAPKQVLIFGTEGMVMVSPAVPGILAAVAGAGVKVGLLRLALNDCLRRLGEVS